MKPVRVLVTGSTGLIGTHLRARLHALNAHARFVGDEPRYLVSTAGREDFERPAALAAKVRDADVVVHLAAVNRSGEGESHARNAGLAEALVAAFDRASVAPRVVYANSAQSVAADNAYGVAKREAARALLDRARERGGIFVDLVLPHVFGEAGRANHNTVTSTLCANAVAGVPSSVREGATVQLLHADVVARRIVRAFDEPGHVRESLEGLTIRVHELDERIRAMRDSYRNLVVPDLSDPFDLELFNTYRYREFPGLYPLRPTPHADARGVLFEAVKGGGGGQTFLSWTEPGVTRGDHFHLRKMERFMVVQGTATIRVRPIFSDTVSRFEVSGAEPVAVDMPTLHAHSIENVGADPLLTLFWAHEVFDPEDPDTYAEPVLPNPASGPAHGPAHRPVLGKERLTDVS